MMTDDLAGQIRSWLLTEGYPLEYAVAREFRQQRIAAQQGATYRDSSAEGKLREIDVLGELRGSGRKAWVVVECKAARLPWVVLTHELPVGEWQPLLVSSSYNWRQLIQRTIAIPHRHGFSLVQALKKGDQDPAYAALHQVTSAASGMLTAKEREGAAFAMPVLVVSSPLYALHVDDDGAEEVKEADWQRILWAGAVGGRTVVDVVHRPALAAYVRELRANLSTVLTEDTGPY